MIESRWRNVCTVITSVLLMLFAMIQVIVALALNLRSDAWVDPKTDVSATKTRLTTGINILIDALFIFPAAWAGICAAVSRSRGVYIVMEVITALALLGAIGGMVDIAYEFGTFNLFVDSGSLNDELAITLIVMQSMLILIIVALLAFGVVALLFECPRHQTYKGKERLMGTPPNYNHIPTMTTPSYISHPTQGYPSAPRPDSMHAANTLQNYRPLTRGSPEWDRFYEDYFGSRQRYSEGNDRRSKRKSNSYRY